MAWWAGPRRSEIWASWTRRRPKPYRPRPGAPDRPRRREVRALVELSNHHQPPPGATRPWRGPCRRGRYCVTGFRRVHRGGRFDPGPARCTTGHRTACRSCASSAWPRPGQRATWASRRMCCAGRRRPPQGRRAHPARAWLRESAELAVYGGYPLRMIDVVEKASHCAGRPAACEAHGGRRQRPRARRRAVVPLQETGPQRPLAEARRALDDGRSAAAESRGAAMTLAAAVESADITAARTLRMAWRPGRVPDSPRLSARERAVVTLVAQGRTDAADRGEGSPSSARPPRRAATS